MTAATSSPPRNWMFPKELYSIPMVNQGWLYGSALYKNMKTWNQVVHAALSNAEELCDLVVNSPTLLKLIDKMENPLAFMDRLAADGLVALEQHCPAIMMEPDHLKEEALKKAVVLKGAGTKKLDDVMHDVCRRRRKAMLRALNLLEAVVGPRVAIYVDVVERQIDDYLPPIPLPTPAEDDSVVAPKKQEKILVRLAYIPRTVQERLVQRYNQYVVHLTYGDTTVDEEQDRKE